ncbi:transposase, partial [Shigella flexneri]
STLKSPSYTKSVSWQHYRRAVACRQPGIDQRDRYYYGLAS